MPPRRIALIAHDEKKDDLVDWAGRHQAFLTAARLWATGTTGSRIAQALGLEITCLHSGPLGGDAQIGAMIAEGRIDVLIFFTDPLSAMPHDVDVKSLLRLAVLYDIPTAMSPATADLLMQALVAADAATGAPA